MQSTEQLLREALERIIQWDDAGLALTEDLIANAKAAVEQSVKGVEPRISTKHGPWPPSRYHEGETYCQRCLPGVRSAVVELATRTSSMTQHLLHKPR